MTDFNIDAGAASMDYAREIGVLQQASKEHSDRMNRFEFAHNAEMAALKASLDLQNNKLDQVIISQNVAAALRIETAHKQNETAKLSAQNAAITATIIAAIMSMLAQLAIKLF